MDVLYSHEGPFTEPLLDEIKKEASSLILETKALQQALTQRGVLFQRVSIMLIEAKYLSLTI